jgi:hypothetical protein
MATAAQMFTAGIRPLVLKLCPHLAINNRLSHNQEVLAPLIRSGMAGFSVFFCDSSHCGIQPVRAMDPDHAIDQVRRAVPDLRRVAVLPDELLAGVDPELLLQEWMDVQA